MSDTEHNQDNVHRRDRSQPPGDQEHETHVMALVLLSLATIVIITIILSVNREVTDLNPNTYDDEITQPADETHGAGVPIEPVKTTEVSGLSELPSNLPVPQDAETIRNYSSDIGETGTQRVYMYSTQETISDLVSIYEDWVSDSDFTVTDKEVNGDNATVRTEAQNQKLIVSVSSGENGRDVQINYITQNE